ncbi:Hsp20/alpha crystallin family protein [Rhodoferax saidenbachensis]|uniref:Uncharacterized protein n=1 Tax=Rhodoferax saidenbachensis TaxID=1484693 RepID=A0A1P8KC44_9BURK|nr:Hsp20/alpha crystallin family protein [Rhodoferax saidenbachensis]APW43535.1 hypothetical protein RS694_14000 [Rhodoferax saidenbachensis]
MFFATSPVAYSSALRRPAYAHAGRTVERFLDDVLTGSRPQYAQDDTTFTLTLDVPGIAKDQLSIAIEDAVVRISSKEGAPRRYRAAYELPQDIDAAQSEAKLENGVLTLKLTKKVPVNNASELTIQ